MDPSLYIIDSTGHIKVKGVQGAQGIIGPPGIDGAPGEDGVGQTGPAGPTGPQGIQGIMGPPGDDSSSVDEQIWVPPGSAYPSQLTTTAAGDQPDFNTGNSVTVFMNNATLTTIRGIVAGLPGQIVTFISVGASQVDFVHQDATDSTAANRLINTVTSINTSIYPGKGTASYQYDASALRWRLIRHEQGNAIAYTPTWSASVSNPAIGNGTLSGSYYVRGANVLMIVNIVAGSTTTFGSGFWVLGTPSGISPTGLSDAFTGVAIDVVNGPNYGVTVGYTAAVGGGLFGVVDAPNANVDSTHPFAWANTDQYRINAEFVIS